MVIRRRFHHLAVLIAAPLCFSFVGCWPRIEVVESRRDAAKTDAVVIDLNEDDTSSMSPADDELQKTSVEDTTAPKDDEPPVEAASKETAARLKLNKGDHICLVGNALGERMQHHNYWEALLHQRYPELELTVRNLCFPRRRAGGAHSLDELRLARPTSRA